MIPTLVIGIGKGGIGVMESIQELVHNYPREENNYFEFVAIDSAPQVIEKLKKKEYSNFSSININLPNSDGIVDELIVCPYACHKQIKLSSNGALRQRSFARFLADIPDNYEKMYRNIRSKLVSLSKKWVKDAAAGQQNKLFNVFVVHTMGGGTGSGVYTTILRILDELIRSKNTVFTDNTINQSKDIKIFGIGILSTAATLNIQYETYDTGYFANCYGALRELEILSKASHDEPVQFARHFDNKTYPFKNPPFNGYFLHGVSEDLTSEMEMYGDNTDDILQSYFENLNERIAKSILALYNSIESENTVLKLFDNTMFATSNAAEMIIPIDDVKKIMEVKNKLGIELNDMAKSYLNANINNLFTSIGKLSEKQIETELDDVFTKHKYSGIEYYLNEFEKKLYENKQNVNNRYNEFINEIWNKLKLNDKNDIMDVNGRSSMIEESLSNRITQLNKRTDSPEKQHFYGALFGGFKSKKNTINDKIVRYLEILKKIQLFKNEVAHIEELNNYMRHSIPFNGSFGKSEIIEMIESLQSELRYKTDDITKKSEGFIMRVPIQKESLDNLEVGISDTHNTIFDNLNMDNNFKNTFLNRLSFLQDIELTYKPDFRKKSIKPSVCVLYNKVYDEIINKQKGDIIKDERATNVVLDIIHSSNLDIRKIYFNEFLSLPFNDIQEFTIFDDYFKEGTLGQLTNVNPICKIFAHPEWFDKETMNTALGSECWGDRF